MRKGLFSRFIPLSTRAEEAAQSLRIHSPRAGRRDDCRRRFNRFVSLSPLAERGLGVRGSAAFAAKPLPCAGRRKLRSRSEEHTSELQSLMRISYAVFCLKKKRKHTSKQVRHSAHTNTKH